MLFNVLSKIFNYVINVIEVLMSLIFSLHVYVYGARLSLSNHAINGFHIFIILSMMDCLVCMQCHLVQHVQCSKEQAIATIHILMFLILLVSCQNTMKDLKTYSMGNNLH